jgi:hypothetical protein
LVRFPPGALTKKQPPNGSIAMITIRNRWTNETIQEVENLRNADLSGADLSGAVLSGADLRGAVLSGADLRDAVLSYADLSGANLRDAVLSGAVLSGADLSYADLSYADLSGANLRDAVLSGAVLRNADLRDLKRANWQSHDLIAEFLRRSANTIDQEMVAGFIMISRHRCWSEFISLKDHSQFDWAIGVLRNWARNDDSAPKILRSQD